MTQIPKRHRFEFIALIAYLTAMMGMSIDAMLPSLGVIAHELGAAHENDRQLVIIFYFLGTIIGTPIFGPVSDSIGRKPSIFAGLAIYIAGSLMCFFAGNFTVLLAGRLVQGFGGASPRIVAMAMVRDGAKGAAMAQIMSFVMSVFMLVPVFAPSIGQAVVAYASWRDLFLGFAVAGIIAGVWLETRQAETLAKNDRRPFHPVRLWEAAVEVVTHRVSLGYTLATGFVFGVFLTYLSCCQQIYADQYGQGDKFPYWFGAMAICIAFAMVLNGNLVHRIGMRKLTRYAMAAYLVIWLTILALSLASGGQPHLYVLAGLFACWFFVAGFTFGNFNALAMEPMGHIAGMAAAISGTLSQGLGTLLGFIAGRAYNGTITPLAIYFCVFALAACACMLWAEGGRRLKAA